MSWAAVVAGGRGVAKPTSCLAKKKVQWQDGVWNLGVETRVYFVDEDHPAFEHVKREECVSQTKYWDGVDTGGKTVTLKHVPYKPGEMLEETVVIDGEVVGNRGGFSQMIRVDGSELTSTIFGKLVVKFANGVPAPAPEDGGLARTKKVRVKCPDFFKTGAGKEYVGSQALREKIDEALEKIKNEGEFGLIKETIPLHRDHSPMLELFKEAYGAGVAAAADDKKFKFNPEAAVFIPKTRAGDDWGRIMVPVDSDLLENKTNTLAPAALTRAAIWTHTAQPIVSWGHGTAWEL
jgi:hypothetical protein